MMKLLKTQKWTKNLREADRGLRLKLNDNFSYNLYKPTKIKIS